ncbi:TonB-dependent receptor [Mucilaginibacter jinjuensis]|uniref:TonB-dependent receptor n=1 Tax=Mucilaginibacter jinjuensis TaxID=1176721 RepID=A0ABY7T5W8_9SPHI|nr:TonB-dependent receptor [Mucilaginibacter jinjuensis]WCT10657.1 TonB-dependent receptor [Mucilaginibacter jinjuensis]
MRKLLTYFLLLFSSLAVHAQVTTGTLTGTIKDAKEMLIGVTITATHLPTGTVYGAATNKTGRFTIPGMRPGGPYRIKISYIGYEPKIIDNIDLKIGDPYVLNVSLDNSSVLLSEVAIKTADRNSILNADRTGTSTNLSTREINALPTIDRSLNDLTRLTPQSNGNSIGGGNSRQNNVTLDGADFNNNFGIGSNLPGNGNPVSIDALEEISVNVTPYDIRQTGFIGGSINAVTRSGTNDVSASAYTYFRNQNQIGTKVSTYPELVATNQSYRIYGARVGGPIIKNKLFLFLNAERETEVDPGQTRVAATDAAPFGSAPNITRPTMAELDAISAYLKNKYGYETGPYQGYNFESERTNLLARLDWNINDKNHFNVRYSYVKTRSPSFVSTSRSPLPGFSNGSRTDTYALPFANSNYYQEANLYSLTAELDSKIGSGFNNTLRLSYTNQNDPRSSDSQIFPFVDILKDGRPFTSFGYEPFTYGNLRDVQLYSLNDYLTWSAGKHNFTAGVQGDFSITKNGFQRFATSYYTFNSWDDFVNGAKPADFAQTYSLSPGYAQAYPTFKFGQYSVYGQDEIAVSDKFHLTVGLRLDLGAYPKVLEEHPLVSQLTFAHGEHLNTGNLPSAKVLFSPRIGFNWDLKGDRSLQLRGGAGIFTGKIPYVWIVAQSGDAGMLQVTETYSGQNNTPGPFNPNIGAYRPATPPAAGTVLPNPITVMAKDLKMPQTYKMSLALDAKLPFGIVGTIEGIFNKDINTVLFRNANLVDPKPLNVAGYPDNRMIYPNANTDKFINPILNGQAVPNGTVIPGGGQQPGAFNVIVLDNSSRGYYYSITTTLAKRFSNGFGGSISYVHSDAKSLYEGGGDQTLSGWQGTTSVNGANQPELGHSGSVSPDRIIASVYYRKEFIKHLGSQVTLVYDGSNSRFSYTYSGDINRDGANADLIYVPKDPSEITFVPLTVGSGATAVTYTAQQQSDMFFRYIDQDKYLRGRKGKYAERNGAIGQFQGQFDFKFLQDIFTNVGGKRNTIQFSLDILNVGNFLNKEWGIQRSVATSNILVPKNIASLVPGGNVKPTFTLQTDRNLPASQTFRDNVGFGSTWTMQFGFRYIFN